MKITSEQLQALADLSNTFTYNDENDNPKISMAGLIYVLQTYDDFKNENSNISKMGREIAEMNDEEFEANCRRFEKALRKSGQML